MNINPLAITKMIAGALIGASIFTSTAAFAETTLALSSWLPPRHPIVVDAIKPWAKEVNEVTDGRVTVRILTKPLGSPPSHYDMAVDGIADITYGLHSFTTDDRFERSRIGQFSFISDNAVSGSSAFWNVYSGQLDAQAEHEGVKLLGLFVHGPGVLHNNIRKIEALEDITGLKIRVPGGYISDLMSDLGAETLFMSSGEVFEKLSRGVIDGVTFPFDAMTAFKLTDDLKYSMRVPGGLYNTTWFLVMNEGAWEGISKEDQAAIEAISGAAFAARVGAAWDASDQRALVATEEAGIEIFDAPEELLKTIKSTAAKHEAAWAKAIAEDGFDGVAALKELRMQTGVEY